MNANVVTQPPQPLQTKLIYVRMLVTISIYNTELDPHPEPDACYNAYIYAGCLLQYKYIMY